MSILKFENRTPRNLQKMYKYLCNPQKTNIYGIFGIGLNPMAAVADMKFMQNLYGQHRLTHEYFQVIFTFDKGLFLDIFKAREICIKIGEVLITDKRQVFGAIHYLNKDAQKMHCHYLINYVGTDGSLYRQKYSVYHYRNLINGILKEYGLNPVESISQNKEDSGGNVYYEEFEDYNSSTEYDYFFGVY